MTPILAMRALAFVAAFLAALVTWSAASGSRSWLQLLAKVLFALLLLAMARLAWKQPEGRTERARRRILRLVAVVLSEERRREWAESTPSTDPDEALLADLRSALGAGPEILAAAFDAEELALIFRLRTELNRADLPAGLHDGLRATGQAIQDAALVRAQRVGQRAPSASPESGRVG